MVEEVCFLHDDTGSAIVGGCANADLDGMRWKREEHRWPLLWWAGWGEPEIEAGKLAN